MLGITNVSNAPSIVLKNTEVKTESWTSGSYNGYSYRGTIPITGVTADTIAEVTFSQAQAESGNYSSVCTTYDGGLYIYAKVNTTITIPSIIIHSIVESYYSVDTSPPTSGKTTAISSGAVYDAINETYSISEVSHHSSITVFQSYYIKKGNVVQLVIFYNVNTAITTGSSSVTFFTLQSTSKISPKIVTFYRDPNGGWFTIHGESDNSITLRAWDSQTIAQGWHMFSLCYLV